MLKINKLMRAGYTGAVLALYGTASVAQATAETTIQGFEPSVGLLIIAGAFALVFIRRRSSGNSNKPAANTDINATKGTVTPFLRLKPKLARVVRLGRATRKKAQNDDLAKSA